MSKKKQREKIERAVRRHGSVVVFLKEPHYDGDRDDFRRRRKISSDGECFVSFLSDSMRRWSRYHESCFVWYFARTRSLSNTLNCWRRHDKDTYLQIDYMILPSGRKVDLN